jgi:hypothetical protein
VCGRPVLPDAPIVIVRAAAWFIINLFIILMVQIANKMGSQKKLKICGLSADGRKSTTHVLFSWELVLVSVSFSLGTISPAHILCVYSTQTSNTELGSSVVPWPYNYVSEAGSQIQTIKHWMWFYVFSELTAQTIVRYLNLCNSIA